MQRTSNYQLPQWEKEDRILMEDFNGAMANIESAIDGAKSEASSAVEAARSEASASFRNAYSPENKPYATGTYTGTNLELNVPVGFKPSVLFIAEIRSESSPGLGCKEPKVFFSYDSTVSRALQFTSTGFKLTHQSSDTTPTLYAGVNQHNIPYFYVALR